MSVEYLKEKYGDFVAINLKMDFTNMSTTQIQKMLLKNYLPLTTNKAYENWEIHTVIWFLV